MADARKRDPWANQKDYRPFGEGLNQHPRRDKPLNAKQRKCLVCEKMFASTWEGNRICPPCAARV